MNSEDVIIHILRTLDQAGDRPLAQDVLVIQVACRVRPRPSQTEIIETIAIMSQRGLVMRRENELDLTGNNPCWLLDDKGQSMVSRMRI